MDQPTSRLTWKPARSAAELRRECDECGITVPARRSRCGECGRPIRGLSCMRGVSCRTLYERTGEKESLIRGASVLGISIALLLIWVSSGTVTGLATNVAAACGFAMVGYGAWLASRWQRYQSTASSTASRAPR